MTFYAIVVKIWLKRKLQREYAADLEFCIMLILYSRSFAAAVKGFFHKTSVYGLVCAGYMYTLEGLTVKEAWHRDDY